MQVAQGSAADGSSTADSSDSQMSSGSGMDSSANTFAMSTAAMNTFKRLSSFCSRKTVALLVVMAIVSVLNTDLQPSETDDTQLLSSRSQSATSATNATSTTPYGVNAYGVVDEPSTPIVRRESIPNDKITFTSQIVYNARSPLPGASYEMPTLEDAVELNDNLEDLVGPGEKDLSRAKNVPARKRNLPLPGKSGQDLPAGTEEQNLPALLFELIDVPYIQDTPYEPDFPSGWLTFLLNLIGGNFSQILQNIKDAVIQAAKDYLTKVLEELIGIEIDLEALISGNFEALKDDLIETGKTYLTEQIKQAIGFDLNIGALLKGDFNTLKDDLIKTGKTYLTEQITNLKEQINIEGLNVGEMVENIAAGNFGDLKNDLADIGKTHLEGYLGDYLGVDIDIENLGLNAANIQEKLKELGEQRLQQLGLNLDNLSDALDIDTADIENGLKNLGIQQLEQHLQQAGLGIDLSNLNGADISKLNIASRLEDIGIQQLQRAGIDIDRSSLTQEKLQALAQDIGIQQLQHVLLEEGIEITYPTEEAFSEELEGELCKVTGLRLYTGVRPNSAEGYKRFNGTPQCEEGSGGQLQCIFTNEETSPYGETCKDEDRASCLNVRDSDAEKNRFDGMSNGQVEGEMTNYQSSFKDTCTGKKYAKFRRASDKDDHIQEAHEQELARILAIQNSEDKHQALLARLFSSRLFSYARRAVSQGNDIGISGSIYAIAGEDKTQPQNPTSEEETNPEDTENSERVKRFIEESYNMISVKVLFCSNTIKGRYKQELEQDEIDALEANCADGDASGDYRKDFVVAKVKELLKGECSRGQGLNDDQRTEYLDNEGCAVEVVNASASFLENNNGLSYGRDTTSDQDEVITKVFNTLNRLLTPTERDRFVSVLNSEKTKLAQEYEEKYKNSIDLG